MTRKLLFAAGCAALLALPLAVNSQPPGGDQGGRGGRGGRGGFGMMGGDPNQFFDFLSKGKDVIRRDDLDPNFQRMFDRMASAQNITNGQITRDQFKTITESFANRGRNGPGGPPVAPGGTSGGPPGRGEMTPEQIDRQAEDAFRRHDGNGDGQLQYAEMPEGLKSSLATYDANKDGQINLEEYKAYYRDRVQIRQQENATARGPNANGQPAPAEGLPPVEETAPVQEEDKRPTVYRYGKLPKDLPPWFAELDTYKDGQIWLSSWVKAGRSVEEFRAMDRNDDGLLTVDEYLAYKKANTTQSPGDTVVANANGGGEERGNGRSAFPGAPGSQGSPWGGRQGRGGPAGGDDASGSQFPGGGRMGRGGPGGGSFGGMPGGGRGNRGGFDGQSGRGDSSGDQGGGRRGGRGGRGGGGPPGGGNSDRGNAPSQPPTTPNKTQP